MRVPYFKVHWSTDVLGRIPLSSVCAVVVAATGLAACAGSPWYDHAPPMPRPISPQVGATVTGETNTVFVWSRTEETESYEFHVFNDETDDIDQYMRVNLDPAEICAADTCSISLRLSLPDLNRHAWRVRSSNVAGKSPWTRSLFAFAAAGTP